VYGHESFPDEIKIESRTENNVFEVYVFFKKKNINPFSKFSNYKNYYLKGLNYLLENNGKPDVLQVNILFPAGIAALEIQKKLNIPMIVSEHWTGYHPEDGSYKGFIKKYFSKKTVQKASKIVTVTKNLQNAMISHGLNGNYSVVPNVVNTEVFTCSPELKQKFRFLHVSSLDPRQKNTGGIISAFRKINQQHPETELIIIGNGENKKDLENKSGKLLNRSIIFSGQKFDKDLASEFNEANCFVLFSNYENLPVVILEALCCGTPVISSDVGGIREFLKPEQGLLVKAGDENELVSSMKKIMGASLNYDRKAISIYGKESFSLRQTGQMYSEIYEEVLRKH
jgi:glycosyltransferase involved in cell wall biosynthesis